MGSVSGIGSHPEKPRKTLAPGGQTVFHINYGIKMIKDKMSEKENDFFGAFQGEMGRKPSI
jgi:hypothetical protein